MADDFNGKIVLVTGAGSGIGREAALAFSSRGAYVYAADVNEQGLAETGDLIIGAGGKAAIARIDVASEKDVCTFVARIERDAGRLDAVFNNAGITGGTYRIEEYPTDDFDTVIRVNLRSVFLGMKYELPLMKRSGGGPLSWAENEVRQSKQREVCDGDEGYVHAIAASGICDGGIPFHRRDGLCAYRRARPQPDWQRRRRGVEQAGCAPATSDE